MAGKACIQPHALSPNPRACKYEKPRFAARNGVCRQTTGKGRGLRLFLRASIDVHVAKSIHAAGGVQWLTPTTTTKATTFIATLATAASLTAGKKIVIRAVFAKM